MLTRKLFTVSGRFVIPGTRETASFSGRVFAESPQAGSKDLAAKLQEDYGWTREKSEGKRAPRDYVFSRDFALMHLQWTEAKVNPNVLKAVPRTALTPDGKLDESVIEAAVIAVGGIVSPIESVESTDTSL
jgi:hypothetical protein